MIMWRLLSVAEQLTLYRESKQAYHSGEKESTLSDKEFDELEAHLKKEVPHHPILHSVGYFLGDIRDKHKLPYQMGSLDKIRPTSEGIVSLQRWLAQAPESEAIVVMDKLDGSSGMLVYDDGQLTAAYTRGDGTYGKQILRHVVHIPSIPHKLPGNEKGKIYIRVELLILRRVFEKSFSKAVLGEEDGYKNARNMVAGVLNRKTPQVEELRHFSCLTFEVVGRDLNKEHQFDFLKKCGFETAPYTILRNDPESLLELLPQMLRHARKNSPFETDGQVLEFSSYALRNTLGYDKSTLNPKFACAFKDTEQEDKAEASVVAVHWAVSKDGYLKPRIEIEPVELAGVTVTSATCHNAAYIRDNNINIGAKLLITRSGDVIPYILEVIVPSDSPAWPSVAEFGNYSWNKTEVDLVTDEESDTQRKERLIHFFGSLGVEHFSGGWIERFYEAGYDDIYKILSLTTDDMIENIEGIKEKMAAKLHDGIHSKLKDIYLPLLMKGSGCFSRGFGESRSELLYNIYKDNLIKLNSLRPGLLDDIIEIKGFSDTTAQQFIDGLPKFIMLVDKLLSEELITLGKWEDFQTSVKEDRFKGAQFVFTGFRDEESEARIVELGGVVGSGVNKDTTYLVAKDPGSNSNKFKKALELGAKIIGRVDLEKMLK